jgi:probable F420-dependent oxidoreductase
MFIESTPRPRDRAFRFGVIAVQAHSGETWAATARRAEALGYSTLLTPDTSSPSSPSQLGPTAAPIPALAVAATVTRSLRIGTFVLVNDFRNPVLVARESATLDVLSGGRFELGLGAGRPNARDDCRGLGIPFDPGGVRVERLSEAVRIIKELFAGDVVPLVGGYYSVDRPELFPRPVQKPAPPVLIAGSGRRLLSVAARQADIIAVGVRPDEGWASLEEKVGWIRRVAQARFAQLELSLNLAVVGARRSQPWLDRLGLDLGDLLRCGSPSVLIGSPDTMCERLLLLRDALSLSYITVAEFHMEDLAPVVERLAGR